MSKTIETCDGRYGIECQRPAQVFWPAGGNQWCIEHAPSDSGWLPKDDSETHEGDADGLCWTCNETWPCTHEKERIMVQKTNRDRHFDVECSYCRDNYQSPLSPSHEAMASCQSGGRNHCTCSTCF